MDTASRRKPIKNLALKQLVILAIRTINMITGRAYNIDAVNGFGKLESHTGFTAPQSLPVLSQLLSINSIIVLAWVKISLFDTSSALLNTIAEHTKASKFSFVRSIHTLDGVFEFIVEGHSISIVGLREIPLSFARL